jgi:putative glutamine amidotransferase
MAPKRPVVGVIGSAHTVEGKFTAQRVGERNLRAVAEAAGALPLMFAGTPEITDIGALLDTVDGVLLTGARANVHPSHFGHDEHPAHEPYDRGRDAIALELIEACVARGVPLFGICRGFQEMNVAFGGTLHQRLHEVPGHLDHRDDGTQPLEVQYGPAHDVTLEPDGVLRALAPGDRIRVNSLHNQGIDRLGAELAVEARAPDGVIEAFRVRDAQRFALAVQWHPEWQVMSNPFSRALFAAFGQASRERASVKERP